MPPQADTGSPAKAFSRASNGLLLTATPQGLVCLTTTQAVCFNSLTSNQALSISKKLLYDKAEVFGGKQTHPREAMLGV